MERIASAACLLVVAGCAGPSANGPESAAPRQAQLAGLSLPDQVAGFRTRWVGIRPDSVVEFLYFAPSPGGPTLSVHFPPTPDSPGTTVLRETLEGDVAAFLSSRIVQDRGEAGEVQPIEVVGADRNVYDGWCATMWHRGSRLLQWICYFEKQDRLVAVHILDDNLNPTVTASFVREFASGVLGGLVVAPATSA